MQKRKAAANVFREQYNAEGGDEQQPINEVNFGNISSGAPAQAASGPPLPYPLAPEPNRSHAVAPTPEGLKTSEELQLEKEPLRVRETGLWLWKRVIVPPNAYVVHTRAGRAMPLTLGLGLSFRYNSMTDAYLIVPAAMQTIGVVANCISKEKQGINVLAYVQWQIDDFSVAYRKLDFSDTYDPLGIVNAQLREQAEAAIKDKIATMSVEEVLTDKQPVIEELTTRLKAVAEGQHHLDNDAAGLGIKIVTVQIKEALVSSQRLWNDLQAPFRYEQDKTARISFLEMQDLIRQKELETRQVAETSQAESVVIIERIKQSKQTEAQELRLREEAIRFTREQETTRQRLELEEQTIRLQRESEQRLQSQQAQIEQVMRLDALQRQQAEAIAQAELTAETNTRQKTVQTEEALKILAEEERLAQVRLEAQLALLDRQRVEAEEDAALQQLLQLQAQERDRLALEARLDRSRQETTVQLQLQTARNQVDIELAQKQAEIARLQQEVRNLTNQQALTQSLIGVLPQLAAEMPEIQELRVLQTGSDDGFDPLINFITKMTGMAEHLGLSSKQPAQLDT